MTQQQPDNKLMAGILPAVIATIIWAGNFIIARGIITEVPPVSLAFYRWLLATLVIIPFAWGAFRKEFHLVKKHFLFLLLAAITGISMFNTFVYVAGHYTDAINLALIGTTTSPVISVVLARIFLKERVPFSRVVGMIICIIGILLLLSKGKVETLLSLSFSPGDWWMLAAAFAFAVYNVTAKKKPAGMSSVNFLLVAFFLGTMVLLPFYLVELSTSGGFAINVSNIGAILYLGIGASVICFLLWNKAIAQLGAGRASLFGNLIPVFSSIEAVILLGEKVNWFQAASFAVVIAGLLVANLKKTK